MIDVLKEIKRYKPIDMNQDMRSDNEISTLLLILNKTIERIGKDQYKSLRQIDEVMEVLERRSTFEKLIEESEKEIKDHKIEIEKILGTVIEICDMTEDMYIYSLKSSNISFCEQIELQWNKLQHALLKSGIKRIGNKGDIFDRKLHTVKEVREAPGFADGRITEVFKSGYIYKDIMIRKAEVIICMENDNPIDLLKGDRE